MKNVAMTREDLVNDICNELFLIEQFSTDSRVIKKIVDKTNNAKLSDVDIVNSVMDLKGKIKNFIIDCDLKNSKSELKLIRSYIVKAIDACHGKDKELSEDAETIKLFIAELDEKIKENKAQDSNSSKQYADAITLIKKYRSSHRLRRDSFDKMLNNFEEERGKSKAKESRVRGEKQEMRSYYDTLNGYQVARHALNILAKELTKLKTMIENRNDKRIEKVDQEIVKLTAEIEEIKQEILSIESSIDNVEGLLGKYSEKIAQGLLSPYLQRRKDAKQEKYNTKDELTTLIKEKEKRIEELKTQKQKYISESIMN